MRFTGNFDELKEKLSSLNEIGAWNDLNDNQKQFKHKNGGILNWYPSTGTLNFQGKGSAASELTTQVEGLLREVQPPPPANQGPTQTQLVEQAEQLPWESEISVDAEEPIISDTERLLLDNTYSDSEIIIGLVGAVGTDLEQVKRITTARLGAFNYTTKEIRVSKDIIKEIGNIEDSSDSYKTISSYMNEGNKLRELSEDNSILALAVSAKINHIRTETSGNGEATPLKRTAFVINSIKHPDEVQRLRQIYSNGFFLVGVYADEKRRFDYLTKNLRMSSQQASELIERDADECDKFGQHTRDAFHLSDFFIHFDGNADKFQNDIWRTLDLIFGKPYVTPTFDEFAMFMAFSASLRSADLSRQVGAVVARDENIIATGANDIPKAGGGLYWPEFDVTKNEIVDAEDGRDYKRGEDSNAVEKRRIIQDILDKVPDEHRELLSGYLESSRIKDITEYGRVVHAEMEAILACARNNIGTKGAELYCTTFPCHNCAKHIIASGIKRVVYVEPYPKSKAFEFHSDSISLGKSDKNNVVFEPFVGVGPRSFFNLFSMNSGSGYPIKRKNKNGAVVDWSEENGRLRMQMLPCSYLERETLAANLVKEYLEKNDEK